MAQRGTGEARAGSGEHRGGAVYPDRACGAGREELEHAPGSGADVEKGANLNVADGVEDQRLDLELAHVQ